MTHTLTIALTETEMQALKKAAALNCRRPQEQARFLLRSILLDKQQDKQRDEQLDSQRENYRQQLATTIRNILESGIGDQ